MNLFQCVDLVARIGLVGLAIYFVYRLQLKAIEKDLNGRALATAIAVILALVLSVLGVHIQDVLFK